MLERGVILLWYVFFYCLPPINPVRNSRGKKESLQSFISAQQQCGGDDDSSGSSSVASQLDAHTTNALTVLATAYTVMSLVLSTSVLLQAFVPISPYVLFVSVRSSEAIEAVRGYRYNHRFI